MLRGCSDPGLEMDRRMCVVLGYKGSDGKDMPACSIAFMKRLCEMYF